MNRIKMGKTTPDDEKIKDKINEDWFKYFDKDFRPAKNSEDQTREIVGVEEEKAFQIMECFLIYNRKSKEEI